MKTIELGSTVKDVITGFVGVVTGICSYITGCDQVLVQPQGKKKDCKNKINPCWFDINRVVLQKGVKKIVIVDKGVKTTKSVGPDLGAPIK